MTFFVQNSLKNLMVQAANNNSIRSPFNFLVNFSNQWQVIGIGDLNMTFLTWNYWRNYCSSYFSSNSKIWSNLGGLFFLWRFTCTSFLFTKFWKPIGGSLYEWQLRFYVDKKCDLLRFFPLCHLIGLKKSVFLTANQL